MFESDVFSYVMLYKKACLKLQSGYINYDIIQLRLSLTYLLENIYTFRSKLRTSSL